MTENVGCEPVEDAGIPAVGGEQLPERLAGETPPAGGYEKVSAGASFEQGGAAGFEIGPDGEDGGLADGHEALLVALTGSAEDAQLEVQIADADFAQFADAEARGIQEFHHGAVAATGWAGEVGGLNDAIYLFKVQILRNILPLLRGAQVLGWVGGNGTFPQEKTVEVANGSEVAADGARAEAGPIEIIDMKADLGSAGQVWGIANKLFKTSEIGGISVERISGQTLLKTAEVQKGVNLVTQVYRTFRAHYRHRANDTISREMFET
jgi:hypothetical protein